MVGSPDKLIRCANDDLSYGGAMARSARQTNETATLGSVPLDHASPLPLYVQIKQHLLREIAAWPASAPQFYTDGELCRMFGVSRMTARQAVQELVEEGFLMRRRGAGTFVAARKIEERFAPLVAADLQWSPGTLPARVEVLAFEIQPCPAAIAPSLDLSAGAPVRYLRRLRYAGALAIALDHRYVPMPIAEKALPQGTTRSIVHAIWEHYDLDRAEMALEATSAGADEERWLCVPAGEPLIVRRLRYLARGGEPVMAGISLYRADLVRYTVEVPLTREARERPELLSEIEDFDRLVRFRREFTARGPAARPASPDGQRYGTGNA
jgi:GntR family transcriptional regulator